MPREARYVLVNKPHHITQRGNYKQIVFHSHEDCLIYAKYLNKYTSRYQVEILAYCLMSNHVHLIAIPKRPSSFGDLFRVSHMLYSSYKHKQNHLTGHLWQGRYNSIVLDRNHLFRAMRYVENNPVRAEMVASPLDFPYSSARQHCLLDENPLIKATGVGDLLGFDNESVEWKYFLGIEDKDFSFDSIEEKPPVEKDEDN